MHLKNLGVEGLGTGVTIFYFFSDAKVGVINWQSQGHSVYTCGMSPQNSVSDYVLCNYI